MSVRIVFSRSTKLLLVAGIAHNGALVNADGAVVVNLHQYIVLFYLLNGAVDTASGYNFLTFGQ